MSKVLIQVHQTLKLVEKAIDSLSFSYDNVL